MNSCELISVFFLSILITLIPFYRKFTWLVNIFSTVALVWIIFNPYVLLCCSSVTNSRPDRDVWNYDVLLIRNATLLVTLIFQVTYKLFRYVILICSSFLLNPLTALMFYFLSNFIIFPWLIHFLNDIRISVFWSMFWMEYSPSYTLKSAFTFFKRKNWFVWKVFRMHLIEIILHYALNRNYFQLTFCWGNSCPLWVLRMKICQYMYR